MKNSRLVYSTETGRLCPQCAKAPAQCDCKKHKPPAQSTPFPKDGTIRIRRETAGRNGKTVTAIYGVSLAENDLADLAKGLKRRCGSGGAVKEGVIVIQGDHRETLQAELQKQGYKVKPAGG